MNEYNDLIRKSIKERRKALHLRQSDVAEKLGVSCNAVSNWENGKNSIDSDHLFQLCAVLDISADELVGRHNSDYLTDTEKSLLYAFRLASEDRRQIIMDILHIGE